MFRQAFSTKLLLRNHVPVYLDCVTQLLATFEEETVKNNYKKNEQCCCNSFLINIGRNG